MTGIITKRIFLAAALAALSGSCKGPEKTEVASRTLAVKAMVVHRGDHDIVKTYTGSLEGERQAVVYSRLPEAIHTIHVREGQSVGADQVLITLDKSGSSTRYDEANSVFRNAEKNFQKMESLYKQGAVSESQRDAAKTSYEVSKSNYEAVSRLVEIRTPIGGAVTSIKVSVGDLVQVGQQLATIATTGRLRVKFGINSEDVPFFKPEVPVKVYSDVLTDTLLGTVTNIAMSADPMTRTFQAEALVDNPTHTFKPGMFVRISAITNHLTNVLVVPRAAVIMLDNRSILFTSSGGTAHKRSVTLGNDLDGSIVVTDGLNDGDTLVTLGQTYLDDGTRINVTDVSEGVR